MPQEPSHVRLVPHELACRARAADHVEIIGVGEELQDVAADERPIRLRENDDVALGFLDAALKRVAISLAALLDDARPCLARFPGSAIAGVVVDDDDFVDDIGDKEVLDRRADVSLFVVGREDHADRLRAMHC